MAMPMMKGNGNPPQRQVIPFRKNTQQRIQQNQDDNQKAHTLGSTVNYRIDKYGGLAGLMFWLYGTVTLGGAGTITNLGPWNLVNRFKLTLNNNANVIVDLDGFHCWSLAQTLLNTWGPAGGGNFTPNTVVYNAPVAMGANTWAIPYFIPISLNLGSDVLTGMINMQSQQANLVLSVTLVTTGTDVVSNFSSLSLTGELHNIFYELRKGTEPPPLILCTSQQKTETVTATGITKHEIVPQGDLYSLVMTAVLNSARNSANITDVQFRSSGSHYDYIMNPRMNHLKYEQDYQKPAPTGVFTFDFFHSMELPNWGDERDVIRTNNFTKLDALLNVASGATLGGSGTDRFEVIERRIIPLG